MVWYWEKNLLRIAREIRGQEKCGKRETSYMRIGDTRCNRGCHDLDIVSPQIYRIYRTKQPRGACGYLRWQTLRNRTSARRQVDWPLHWPSPQLAGEYFTRVVKVTDRTELQSVYGFELHRTVRQRKIMHCKARAYDEPVNPILTRTTLVWMNSMRSKACTRG